MPLDSFGGVARFIGVMLGHEPEIQQCEQTSHFFVLVLETSAVGAFRKDPKFASALDTLYEALHIRVPNM